MHQYTIAAEPSLPVVSYDSQQGEEAKAAPRLREPVVFISAVTAELGDARDALRTVFEEHGAKVVVQRNFPNALSDGYAIQRTIDEADLVVCLIGNRYGAALPKGNRPPDAAPGCSWTQWEYLYAHAHARELRVFVFDGPAVDGAESERFAGRQSTFRRRVQKFARSTFGAAFSRRFVTVDELVRDVTNYLENVDGVLGKLQDATWERITSAYRFARIDAWKQSFSRTYWGHEKASSDEKSELMRSAHPPFIASQGLCILVPGPNGEQAPHLKPAAFLPGRDSEAEASARSSSEWRGVTRYELVEALRRPSDATLTLAEVVLPQPRRFFVISGGGVGKSTNMRWLEATLNEDVDLLAVLLGADKVVGGDDASVLAALAEKIAHDAGERDNAWAHRAIARGLRRDGAAGRLVILIDGLDHVEAEKISLLTSIQSRLPGGYWTSCSVVVAGRPQALLGWEDTPVSLERTVALSGWRFFEPAEFEPHEAEIFLGTSDDEGRYKLVDDKLARLVQVPRVLEYVRTLPGKQLAGVRTSADIYDKATRELIKRTLRESVPARTIGPDWEQDRQRLVPRSEQIDYVMKLLSALAFIALCPTTDPAFRISNRTALLLIDRHVKDELWARVAPRGTTPGSESTDLARDLRALAAFAAILGNGLLDASDSDADVLRSVVWSNRTIHQFLAAYWLANHARGFETVAARLEGKPAAAEPEDPDRDTDRFRWYVFYPEADYLDARYERTDVTYEFNQFLAEMPATALSADSWVAAASAWYDPEPNAELGDAAFPRSWAAEMLYRSWPTMLDIARSPLDDWWDLPYEKLVRCATAFERMRASLHGQRQSPQHVPRAARVAQRVLTRFFSDFESLLGGERGARPAAVATEMIADENWIVVPGGPFEMGAPPDKQGFPSKVKAYWIRELDEIQTGVITAKEAAERTTREEWTTGAQGKRLRDRDIQWLTETYRPLEPEAGAVPPSAPDRTTAAYSLALKALENNWSRRDETPLETHQDVAAFTMHRFPILRRWFSLFSPGHRDAVEAYLAGSPHPADDHPAIYVSWYDAWAFCQWATWSEEQPDGGKRQRYGLRLPHEPEWEYAAGWCTDEAGNPVRIPYGQRYWWGDTYYSDEESPTEEPLSNDVAHAVGNPGRTRSPLAAKPNGLGFHDIIGNVWEWTANSYDLRKEDDTAGVEVMHYSRAYPTMRPPVNCPRTMRGGLWYVLDLLTSCSARFRLHCDDRDYKMGFRVVRERR